MGRDNASNDFTLLHTEAECASGYGTSGPGFVVLRKFDEPIIAFEGELSIDSLILFMRT